MTTSSLDAADERHFFFTQAENENELEEETQNRIEQREGKDAKEWIANEEPPSLKTRVKELTKIDGSTTSSSVKRIKANARIRVKKHVILV